MHVPGADGVDEGPRIGQAACDGQADRRTAQDGRTVTPRSLFVRAPGPLDERIGIGFFAFYPEIGIAHGRFHDAARRAENDGAARALA